MHDPEGEAGPRLSLATQLGHLQLDSLKWCAAYWPAGRVLARREELIAFLGARLGDPAEVRRLWLALTPGQREVVAEVVHRLAGQYDIAVIAARYPDVPPPARPPVYLGYGLAPPPAQPFDLLFWHSYSDGTSIPAPLLAPLRALAPEPPPPQIDGYDTLPVEALARSKRHRAAPVVRFTENERAAFHDLTAALALIREGKATVSETTRFPTLGTVRQLRPRLLADDPFGGDYERADEAIRPLALVMLVQVARWAAPGGDTGGKLALTKQGEAALTAGIGPRQVRHAWESWVRTPLLDELARVRTIKGQGAKGVRLTKPAERRARLAQVLAECPPGRWVPLDAFFRHIRATRQSPAIERGTYSGLRLGSSGSYGYLTDAASNYWEFVIGSYLRAVLWEYAGTLGLIEFACTAPEESPLDLSGVYGLDGERAISRYDGLLGFRVTALGAYALGRTEQYTPPVAPAAEQHPVLAILPNLDVVITDARRMAPNDRAFLARLGPEQSQDVFHLSREAILEALDGGLTLAQIRAFLARQGGGDEAAFPQPVRVFFDDLVARLAALREADRVVVLESHDPYLLTELAHDASLRASVTLATIAGRTVLLVPLAQEAAVRRQLRRLGYLPRGA